MSLERTHYDVVLLGTGLSESILAAALARAGRSVLHVDPQPFYGGQWASLSLSELYAWSQTAKKGNDEAFIDFPAAADAAEGGVEGIPANLAAKDRHYSLSLLPTLLPASGRALDVLVRSKVASYATFRLLERTLLYTPPTAPSDEAGGQGMLQGVPCSKEDVFRDRSLGLADKRRIMKLLMAVASGTLEVADPKAPFVAYLRDAHSLSDNVAKAVAYGVALCSSEADETGPAVERAKAHLKATGRYGNSSYLVGQYGGAGELAQSYCRAAAVYGATYILAHEVEKLEAIEVDDKTSVKAAAAALGDGAAAKDADASNARWRLRVAEVEETITADWVVGSSDILRSHSALASTSVATATEEEEEEALDAVHALIVLDRPLPLSPTTSSGEGDASTLPPETALIVFPPGSIGENERSVTVLTMGEGTFSCPKGQYVYYLTTYVTRQSTFAAKEVLQPATEALLRLASASEAEWQSDGTVQRPNISTSSSTSAPQNDIIPLLRLYHRQRSSSTPSSHSNNLHLLLVPFPPPTSSAPGTGGTLVSSLDDAAHQAESLFWHIEGSEAHLAAQEREQKRRRRRDPAEYVGRVGAVQGEEEEDEEGVEFFRREKEAEENDADE